MKNSLVVFSGGQDSTTTLFKAIAYEQARGGNVHALTFNYGQRHLREIDAADKIMSRLRTGIKGLITHETVTLDGHVLRSTSPLTSNAPLETYENHDQMERTIGSRVEKTFVPMRNMLFLTIAANRAVDLNCHRVWTGVCQADNANYPDCRYEFIATVECAINEALGRKAVNTDYISVVTPLIHHSKAASIRLALTLPGCYAALAWSHTAYDGGYPPVSKDHASILRAHGFEQAGVPDPLVLRAWYNGIMDLPGTPNYDLLRIETIHPSYSTESFEDFIRDTEVKFTLAMRAEEAAVVKAV